MKVARTISEFRAIRNSLKSVGLVPTMGALHEGHLSLIRQTKEVCEQVAISIFVNPTQFGPNEDFARYPRNEARDLELAEAAGATLAFCPSVEEMYPSRNTMIHVAGPSSGFEGAIRPGHFSGVATVVAQLFNIIAPDVATFGLKDLQQCAVIRTLVSDLHFPIELKFCEVLREESGLAMSSRNVYLNEKERALAPKLYTSLTEIACELRDSPSSQAQILQSGRDRLSGLGFQVDYLEVVDPYNMSTSELNKSENVRIIVAAKLGTVRLLDNIAVIR